MKSNYCYNSGQLMFLGNFFWFKVNGIGWEVETPSLLVYELKRMEYEN